ncbi:MAG: hypothetical protein KAI08_06740 [Bacteroidales bacterium]|nr:hypothetical protein [Bacteroidales bacterium]
MNKHKFLWLLPLFFLWGCGSNQQAETAHTFSFEMNFSYPGDPVFVYDHLTGDISSWWDHSFSEKPYKLFIDAWPGGGFYEIFNESGDGALHATVIFAERGKMLRMEGPLGLSGQALTLVCTYTLKAVDTNSTQLTLNVNASGEFTDETPDIVRQVWEHFLWEQFKPYIEEHYRQH